MNRTFLTQWFLTQWVSTQVLLTQNLRSQRRLQGLALSLVLLVSACSNANLLGRACAGGYTRCGERCVDLTQDLSNCGTCGNVCSQCEQGVCRDTDAAVDVAPDVQFDSTDSNGDSFDASIDVPLRGCNLGQLECNGACVDITQSRDHCGDCSVPCGEPSFCYGGECTVTCAPGRSICGADCVDTQTDEAHCGACDTPCPTSCVDGSCGAPTAGHLVVIGHDYRLPNVAIDRILSNGVFIVQQNPVRVAIWQGDTDPLSAAGISRALDEAASRVGRGWQPIDVTDADRLPFELARADVVIFAPQPTANPFDLEALTFKWGQALSDFLEQGGVVILLEALSSTNQGTHRILEFAGLVSIGPLSDVSTMEAVVSDPSDALTWSVPLRYIAETSSTAMDSAGGHAVVTSPNGALVIHQIWNN